jgi:PAS domain S-box-containing protein
LSNGNTTLNEIPTKILLIEDDAEYAQLVQTLLSMAWDASFDLEHTNQLSTGLEKLSEKDIDVVLLDLSLPDSWGFDTFTQVYAQASDVPIIVLSGLDDEMLAVQAVRAGAQDYLVKGQADGDLLVRATRYAIERKRSGEEQRKAWAEALQATHALQESNERYRELASSITDVFFAMDGQLRYTYWNKTSEDLTGISAQDAIGKSLLDIFPDIPEIKKVEKVYQEVLRTQQPQSFVNEYLLGDIGLPFEISVYPTQSGISVFARDITERRQADEVLYESEKRYRDLYENAPIAYFSVGVDGHIRKCNKRAGDLLGYAVKELVGRPVFELYADAPLGKEETAQILQRSMTGETVADQELQIRRADGTSIWVSLTVTAVHDAHGQFVESRSMVVDITERKQAEEALKRRNEELMALNTIATTINQSPNLNHTLTATLDQVLEVTDTDAGWIQLLDGDTDTLTLVTHRGFSQETINETRTVRLGDSLTGKVIQSKRPIVVNNVSDDPQFSTEIGKREGVHAFAGVPIKSRDRVLGVIAVFGRSPLEIAPREIQLLTAIGHQIGVAIENTRLSEEASEVEILQELDRLRSELIANVSHELRTPLGLIKIFCTTLLRNDVEFDRETQREFLHDIDAETDKLERIVDNLLDLSRMESGRLHLDKRPMDIAQLARDVVQTMQVDIQPVQHNLVQDFPPTLPMAIADSKYIEQVLRNLLSNAIKYSPEGGTITVGGRDDEMQLLVWVSDQGAGIPQKDLERVFERFYRIENEITRNVRGAGLGLAVCRGIVEAHGGRIWAESILGVGSTFYFTLMRADS